MVLIIKKKKKFTAEKREYPVFQIMKFIYFFFFCGSFLPSWIRIPDPDPLTGLNPDPKHCLA
jgi:hypothetical protein